MSECNAGQIHELSRKSNVTWVNGLVSRQNREELHGHKGAVIWFTGLSASGKSTIALNVEKLLHQARCSSYVFDGDNVRHGLCSDLGFSPDDRAENIRRIGEMVRLFVDAGIIAITAFISPYRQDRERVRCLFGPDRFLEIFVQCPPEVCASRDPKGLYKRALSGEIKGFTGVSAPYEAPESPDLIVHSHVEEAEAAARRIVDLANERSIIRLTDGVDDSNGAGVIQPGFNTDRMHHIYRDHLHANQSERSRR